MCNVKAALRFPNWPQRQNRAGKFVVRLSQARLETPRLRLRPVIGQGRIDLAFELIQLAGIKTGLQLPIDLSSQSFRSKLVGDEPFALFLMEEKVGGDLIGLAGAWAISPSRGWPQILYAVRPEFRGRGYAREAAAVLVENLFRSESVMGVGAIVVGPNPSSQAVLGKLGMELIHQWDERRFFGLSRQQFQQSGCSPVKESSRKPGANPHSAVVRGLRSQLENLLGRHQGAVFGTRLLGFTIRICSRILTLVEGRGKQPQSSPPGAIHPFLIGPEFVAFLEANQE
jgi:RimJ/RimL family protein N-acetyltransferase